MQIPFQSTIIGALLASAAFNSEHFFVSSFMCFLYFGLSAFKPVKYVATRFESIYLMLFFLLGLLCLFLMPSFILDGYKYLIRAAGPIYVVFEGVQSSRLIIFVSQHLTLKMTEDCKEDKSYIYKIGIVLASVVLYVSAFCFFYLASQDGATWLLLIGVCFCVGVTIFSLAVEMCILTEPAWISCLCSYCLWSYFRADQTLVFHGLLSLDGIVFLVFACVTLLSLPLMEALVTADEEMEADEFDNYPDNCSIDMSSLFHCLLVLLISAVLSQSLGHSSVDLAEWRILEFFAAPIFYLIAQINNSKTDDFGFIS